jgi:hypothetical protein
MKSVSVKALVAVTVVRFVSLASLPGSVTPAKYRTVFSQ